MAKSEATLLLKIKTMGQEALKGIEDNFDTMKTAALGAFAVIAGLIVKSLHDYREQEIATNALTQAMVNNGIYSKQLKDDYLAQASAIQKLTLFGDEQVIAAQAAIQSQIGERKVTQQLSMAVADLAQAKGMDLVSAAQLVGKTIGGTTNVLSRQGIEFDNNTRGAERLTAVTNALNSKFGGQATAATSGLGALKQLGNAASDLLETFGEKLTPYVAAAAAGLKAFAEDASNTTPIMDAFISSLKFVAMFAMSAFEGIKELGIVIGVGLATAVEATSAALSGKFSQALDIVKSGNQQIADEIKRSQAETEATTTALFAASENAQKESLAREEANLAQSLENRKNAKIIISEEESKRILDDNQLKYDLTEAGYQMALDQQSGDQAKKLTSQIAFQDAVIKSHADHKTKLAAQELKHTLTMQQQDLAAQKAKEAAQKDSFATIATLSSSNNQLLATIGKAAALTQIAIDTPVAIGKALAAFPPPANFVAAGAVGIAMAGQAARIAGIPLAEGGIVQPRAGGIQATIGEAGQAEAVIPLDRADEFGLGGGSKSNINITVYGGMLGDERTAQEFAQAVDKELLKLQQNGGSVAFGRVT